MHLFRCLLALAAGLASLAAATPTATTTTACNADNCLRQIRASSFPTRSGAADCSAYQTTTAGVTPAHARTIPAYASSCSNDAQYRSACSCIGSTSTFVGTTSSSSSSSTVTPSSSPVCSTFAVQASGGADPGNYFLVSTPGEIVQLTATSLAAASLFILDPVTGQLSLVDGPAGNVLYTMYDNISRINAGISPSSSQTLTCVVSPVGNVLSCTGNGESVFKTGELMTVYFAAAGVGGAYPSFTPIVVPYCP